jgi:hypothetical protein
MTTTHYELSAAGHERSAIGAMYAGLALTVVALIVPYIDQAAGPRSLCRHTVPAPVAALVRQSDQRSRLPFVTGEGRPAHSVGRPAGIESGHSTRHEEVP